MSSSDQPDGQGASPPGPGPAPSSSSDAPASSDGAAPAPRAASGPASAASPDDEGLEVVDLEGELAAMAEDPAEVARQRDDYLDALRHMQADFENYKKRAARQQADATARGAEAVVEQMLPALDAADLAVSHGGGEEVTQVWATLLDALSKQGLERIDPLGEPFDPTRHDAVMHEPGDGSEQAVAEVLRAGYAWKGRVLRPAMVKVRG